MAYQGPVSRKPRTIFGPVKPFLVYLYLKTKKCIHLKPLVHIKNMWIKQLCKRKVQGPKSYRGFRETGPWTFGSVFSIGGVVKWFTKLDLKILHPTGLAKLGNIVAETLLLVTFFWVVKLAATKQNVLCCPSGKTRKHCHNLVPRTSFPELRSPWPAVGKRELWKQPF